jgi:hypothetical protein
MSDEITEAAIAKLERSIDDYEQKIRALRTAINTMCENVGLQPRYADAMLTGSGSVKLAQIQDDTFYGKKQTTAMREYLEMRKTQGIGPASPREIFEALKQGGYQFEHKDDVVALVGLRALLRTQPNVFHKLPQGTYGLTSWYPDAKPSADDGSRRKRRGGAKKQRSKRTKSAVEGSSDNVVNLKAEAGGKAA